MERTKYERIDPRHSRLATSVLVAILIALSVPAAALVASSSAAAVLNEVQVNIQTSQDFPYQYTLTAYNASGNQVASFYGNFPEAGFGLPSGTYLITASASYYQSYYCKLCPLAGGANASMPAIRYQPPSSEYGYAVVKVSGPAQVTIATDNGTKLPLVSLPVHVSFFNGTAAAGVSVSAYVVGMGYSYSPEMVSYGQTGPDGNFTLVMPKAPVQVNAYLSVPVQPPKNVTTVVPVEVGGQKVNLTVYWQPDFVELVGQALILPPQSGASMTLKVQPTPYPIYYATPGQGGVTTVTTVTGGSTGSAGQTAAPGQSNAIAPFDPSTAQLSAPSQSISNSTPNMFATLTWLLIAAAGGLVVVLGVVLGRKRTTLENARP